MMNTHNLVMKYLSKVIKTISYYLLLKIKPMEITKHIMDHQHGLDIGAGAGQYTTMLLAMGYNVVAVEPDIKKIEKSGVPYVVSSGQNLPFDDNQYDFAFAVNVLHHTKRPVELLQEVNRVARRVIISEVNHDNIFVRLYNQFIGEIDNQHLSPTTLLGMMEQAGLTVSKLYTKSFLSVPNVFIYAVAEMQGHKLTPAITDEKAKEKREKLDEEPGDERK